MAGNHRAQRSREPSPRPGRPTRKKPPARLSRRSVVIAVVVALLPALWLGTQRLLGNDDDASRRATTIIPDVTSTRSPTGTPTVSEQPRLTTVAASGPRRLVVGSIDTGFDNAVEPSNGGFAAGSTAEAARWESRGSPASPGTDSVVLVGKVYRQGASAFAGLGAVGAGDVVTLRTQSGAVLRYTVERTGAQPAAGLLRRPELAERKAGRLVLVGILYDARDEDRTGQYQLVVAQLSGAARD